MLYILMYWMAKLLKTDNYPIDPAAYTLPSGGGGYQNENYYFYRYGKESCDKYNNSSLNIALPSDKK